MAFQLDLSAKETIEVVTVKDDSLNMTDEEYGAYINSGADQEHLKFAEGKSFEDTTRFVLRLTLPMHAAKRVMNEQASAKFIDGEITPELNLGYIFEETRAALIDIQNPASLDKPFVYKKAKDGLCSEAIIAGLHANNVLGDVHGAWVAATKGSENLQKKSLPSSK